MAKIVILGAGYGGLLAAVYLQKAGEPFAIINKHTYHHFTTLLHEAAGGRNDVDEYAVQLSEILPAPTSEVIKAEVSEIRPTENQVLTNQGTHTYDYLIFALGNAPEFFGIPGLAEHSFLLRSLNTAKEIRQHIEQQFASYKEDEDPTKLRVIVGGAGLTGIELVGELVDWIPELCSKYAVPKDEVEIINLEAAPVILPMLNEKLQHVAYDVLTKKGADIRTNTKIVRVGKDVVELASGESIEAKTIIWTGGVRANPLVAQSGFQADNRGRAKINQFLQSVDFENVFVIGDSAVFIGENGKPYPPTAQIASQMGEKAAENICNLIQGKPLSPFTPNLKGTLASLGRDLGVGDVAGMKASGIPAALLKEFTKVKYLYSLGGLKMVSQKRGQWSRH
ncbi:NAD(P)/FAD-dependent oxidoreductase [Fodinisporobacter ferrooxydans]|uniref:NAD(P)/FAD-dependent oxidoreductase n=1 Tax=Fodinisporobacter ferrooxydans TaxID=2901836 RepID=A0ABY4CM43_9BACL|nr:NAD(P)/FAD-dependent oxidoreductase [Alicyclobacillaceae bacterium MYW30-H2]